MSVEEIVSAFHGAMLHKSADELADLYAEDGVHEFPFGGLPPYEGREAVREGYRAAWGASPAVPQEVERVALHRTADPEVVVVEQNAHVKVGDQPITVPGLLVLRIRDGRIARCKDFMDSSAIARVRAAAG
ncbi:MAG: nuclear transport factor 2 family protein [Nonomuraea sp.]|nr:nuclear transport factor 2 family protein [Nonomuraea sp.]NUP67068.1 nuclear transport factor 2 family protein [Nonomuraea sp.]NUT12047.1 nuclear transport factor 2 family protein [Nonomuraea sp.]